MSLENYNYAADPRNCSTAKRPILYLEDGSELELPMKWGVCQVCDGEGKHVNPSIDSGGLSGEDFDEDPDFADSYMRGEYDVSCNACKGRTTVPVVDWDQLSPEHKAAYELQLKEEADDRAIHLAEIRAGA